MNKQNKDLLAMKILSQSELSSIIPYSAVHISRLEKVGKFPKRVKLGSNRVGWVHDEVTAWLEQRKDARFDQTEGNISNA